MAELVGLVVLFFSMIVQVIVPPLPAELIVITAGKLYGILWTTLVAGTGLYIGSLIVYFIGFFVKQKLAKFFDKEHVQTIIERIKRYETAILWIRILPYNPADIIAYAAGIMHFDRKKFFTVSLVTSYVRCFLLAVLGTWLVNVQTGLWVLAILVLSAIVAYGLVFGKKWMH